MKTKIAMLLILALLLCGCGAQPAETTAPAETTLPAAQTTQPVPETTAPASDEPVISDLQPGLYLVSSVGRDGDVDFYGTLDKENGWLELNADGTGTFCFEGTEETLTWAGQELTWQGQTLMGFQASYYDPELGYSDTMVALYFMDPMVSVILRPAPEEVS